MTAMTALATNRFVTRGPSLVRGSFVLVTARDGSKPTMRRKPRPDRGHDKTARARLTFSSGIFRRPSDSSQRKAPMALLCVRRRLFVHFSGLCYRPVTIRIARRNVGERRISVTSDEVQ